MSARQLRDLRDDMASYVSATEPMLARWVAELDRAIRAVESAERSLEHMCETPPEGCMCDGCHNARVDGDL